MTNISVTSNVALSSVVSGLEAYVVTSNDGVTCEIHTPANEFYISADANGNITVVYDLLFNGLLQLTAIDFTKSPKVENMFYNTGKRAANRLQVSISWYGFHYLVGDDGTVEDFIDFVYEDVDL